MKIGSISYDNMSGLAHHMRGFREHLDIDSQMVIRHPEKGTFTDLTIEHTFGDREPTVDQLHEYLDKCSPEIVLLIETPFNFDFFKIMHDRGVKVVMIPNVDSVSISTLRNYVDYIDLFLCHTRWTYKIYHDVYPDKTIRIPYPMDTEYFHPDKLQDVRVAFLHNHGYGGVGDRKGTGTLIAAFQQLRGQYPGAAMRINTQLDSESGTVLSANIRGLTLHKENFEERMDTYKMGRVYVAPSRREGLGLPILEAMACGLPVITTDAAPMNEWFTDDRLLVKVFNNQTLPNSDIGTYDVSTFDLMTKMKDALHHMGEMAEIGKENRRIIEEKFSWDVLRDTYIEELECLV